ncbi:kelch domain-containing protein 10-like [Gigantopelta aegis]|uniref:kelch domain-containing protein 10-like n=1 Tax=Gigantopelta aegis TaxID=1735272 RepID=UPI001B88BE6C|nr:kelch domain-containing protein 10-like [Gigantopelta aegis]
MKIFEFAKIEPDASFCTDSGDDNTERVPVERSGHRIVVDDANLYSLGGYNPQFWNVRNTEDTYYPLFKEVWKFNFSTHKWTKIKTQGSMPLELASHAAVRDRKNMLTFGGTGVPFGESSSNDLHVLNLESYKWQHYQCRGDHPEEKYGHAMLLIDDYLYVCGGTTGWIYNIDVHRLNLRTLVWEKLSPKTVSDCDPDGRYRHEIAIHQNKLFMFGGGTAHAAYDFQVVPVFSLEKRIWASVRTVPDNIHGFPAPRRCHSCTQFENDVYVCGGMDGEKITGDVWRLSLVTLQWSRCCDMSVPVYFHSADLTPSGCLYSFGGVTKIDDVRTSVVQRMWLKIPSLKELSWNVLCGLMPQFSEQNKHTLVDLGVPSNFLDRIS